MKIRPQGCQIIFNRLEKRHKKKKHNQHIAVEHKVVELSFTPNKNHLAKGLNKVTVTATIKHTVDLNTNSKLAQILKVNEKFLDLNEAEQIKYIQNYFKEDHKKSKMMGIDMGQVNHTTLSFNYHKKSLVVASRKYNKLIKTKNQQLDKIKANIFPDIVKNLQNKIDTEKHLYNQKKQQFIEDIKNNNINLKLNDLNLLIENKLKEEFDKNNKYPQLNQQEKELINQSFINLYDNEKYIKTLQEINNYKDNYLHKLSTTIVDVAAKEGIDYIIIGRNIDWKQGIDIGKQNNSAMYHIAHYKLIKLIEYKALKYGIVVLKTEESYTSKTSFINDCTLYSYEDKKFNVKDNNNDLKPNSVNANPEKSKPIDFGGIRKNRVFINKSHINKMVKIHADVNGSLNMIRKVFRDFKYHKNLNIYHQIVTIQSHKNHFKYIT